jgi:hypothetical protein
VRPLSEIWPKGRAPFSIHWTIKAVQMLGMGFVSDGLRVAWSDEDQLGVALGEQEG